MEIRAVGISPYENHHFTKRYCLMRGELEKGGETHPWPIARINCFPFLTPFNRHKRHGSEKGDNPLRKPTEIGTKSR